MKQAFLIESVDKDQFVAKCICGFKQEFTIKPSLVGTPMVGQHWFVDIDHSCQTGEVHEKH